jgi:hypothetical protein
VSALAHVFEQAGLATVGISLVRGQAERARPPRMLHCEFPLGRPLGRPDDAAFQHQVLSSAFGLLQRTDVPVLEDFPVTITDEADAPLSCALPPRHNAALDPALDEYDGLRPAWARRFAATGLTSVVRFGGPDPLRTVIATLARIADGEPWSDAGLTAAQLGQAAADIRAFYEEVALELVGHTPAARQSESWLYRQTEMGLLLRRAQAALKAVDAPREAWFRLVPMGQPAA